MNRRGFLGALTAAIAGAQFDPERALWVPGARTISIPTSVKRSAWKTVIFRDITEKEWGRHFGELEDRYIRPAVEEIHREMRRDLGERYQRVLLTLRPHLAFVGMLPSAYPGVRVIHAWDAVNSEMNLRVDMLGKRA